MSLHLQFQAIDEPTAGPKWQQHAERVLPSYSAWFLSQGDRARPGYTSCRAALRAHMPELVPMWERLVELGGGGDQLARLLSAYCPPPYLVACSQAIWIRDVPLLVRNYDYHPARCEGLILRSRWLGTRVIASIDGLWGALDGINEHGLAVSLAFGGRKAVGDGFGIPLVLRYVLELCQTVAEAIEVLRRVPSHMAYSIALVDRARRGATVHVHPDRPADVDDSPVSTNHQREVEWPAHADLTRSVERRSFLAERVAALDESHVQLCARFLTDPLYTRRYTQAAGTLYTAVYRPATRDAVYAWPGRSWQLGIDEFVEGDAIIHYTDERR